VVRVASIIVGVLSCLAFKVSASTTTASSTTAIVSWTLDVIWLMIILAIVVLVGILIASSAPTLALVDCFGHIVLRTEICNIVPTLITGVSRLHRLILVIIWLRVWPVWNKVVGISSKMALVLSLVVISL
jgi:hypothetical protein